jgi:hypothetical protein
MHVAAAAAGDFGGFVQLAASSVVSPLMRHSGASRRGEDHLVRKLPVADEGLPAVSRLTTWKK